MDFASECYKRASNPINWSGSGKPLSKPLSYKERGFEFSPFRAKKAKHPLASPIEQKAKHPLVSPLEQKAKHPLVSPFLRGTEGGSKREEGDL